MLLCASMFAGMFPAAAVTVDSQDHWAAKYMQEAATDGWLEGYSDGSMQPDTEISRAEFTTLLWRALGKETSDNGVCQFADVPTDASYAQAVTTLSAQGIVTGYDADQFCPNEKVTREQGVTMLARAYTLTPSDSSAGQTYRDWDTVSGWAQDAMSAMVECDYIDGLQQEDATALNPTAPITLGQAAAILVLVSDGETDKTVAALAGVTNSAFEGSGTEASPYLVRNEQEMWYVGRGEENPDPYQSWTLDAHYRLTTDGIVLENWLPIGDNRTDTTESRFNGSFDGDGHIITIQSLGTLVPCPKVVEGVNCNYYYVGLFGYVGKTGAVKKLSVAGAVEVDKGIFNVEDVVYVGAITGYNNGTLSACSVSAHVELIKDMPDEDEESAVGGVAGVNR
ncbi:MAG: S-layer homology domain-containing protein [Oscillospiraceae bacterium]|nr:S-layer homology domain-containing protein [Oscillospiraceae bacterium]